ncbi:hypothetical protein FJZ53_01535 [Candidatus Woesearchaeota archaeon]|nr:hypothetical protein [Candidatus Woesearchaeota archaeon]
MIGKYEAYSKLISYNSQALEALSHLRDYTEEKTVILDNKVSEHFNNVMEGIRGMAKSYAKMNKKASLEPLLKKISEIEQDALPAVDSLRLAMATGYSGSEILKEIGENLFEKVERLTADMRSPNSKNFSLKNAETPHDMIRYLHQKGVESMFDTKNLKKADLRLFINIPVKDCSTIMVLDLEGRLSQELKNKGDLHDLDLENLEYKPLKALLELYNSEKFDKSGDEEFKAIVSNEKLIAQIELGCHYSELEAQIGKKNFVRFIFRDTDFESYRNAKHRSAYVRTVLKELGFEVSFKKNETKAYWSGDSEDKAAKILKETLRLAASTKDLDLEESYIDRYPNKAVNAFFKGVTDIESYLEDCYDTDKKDDKKIKH